MHVLLIGSGGREHAMAWKLASSPRVTRVTVTPGNVGMSDAERVHCEAIAVDDVDALLAFAQSTAVDLTIVGPEAPLVAGIVDRFQAAGMNIFGPRAAAAQLEGSKSFAKAFMQRHHIPTAAFATFTHVEEALAYITSVGAPVVVKADGLAAGKGVVVAETIEQAQAAVRAMLADNQFGEAGAQVVIEEFLAGEEASFIAIVGGEQCLPLASSQDHKARDEGDKGPNTGGMGAYSPAPVVTAAVHDRITRQILQPTIEGLMSENMPFTGFLYVGLMIDAQGDPRVVEYNVRLGDPETQPLMLRLDSDLLTLIEAAMNGSLGTASTQWSDDAALGIVLAAGNYPAGSSRGELITGVADAEAEGATVFHSGTRHDDQGRLVTNGGRVLCVTARGHDISDAKARCESAARCINWPDLHYRSDIGHRAIDR